MQIFNEKRQQKRRRRLRATETWFEKTFWSQIRGRQLDGFRFCRQYSVGPYILDFYCPSERLAIELDGPEHFEGDRPERDARRTAFLEHFGIRVLRFRNEEVAEQPEQVLEKIRAALKGSDKKAE